MVKILKNIAGLRRQAVIVVSMLVMMMATLVAVPLAKTSAVGCNYFTETLQGPMYDYSYTWMHWVPSSSGCNDINIQHVWSPSGSTNVCIQLTVRFYPSTGSSYTNGWKQFCGDWGPRVLATNVRNGAQYRVEARYTGEYVGYSIRLFD